MAYRGLLLAIACLAPATAAAASFTQLYMFAGGGDGARPGPVTGLLGRIYGTTAEQGVFGWGNVWSIQIATNEKTQIYNFTGGHDGGTPSGVITVGAKLYGATQAAGNALGAQGAGTLFTLAPATGALTTLYRFTGGSDGASPGVPIYEGGALYGELPPGSAMPNGGIYKYALSTHTETTLLAFPGGAGGAQPGRLITVGTALYGIAAGGTNGFGVLFRVNPATAQETVLYAFTGGTDGAAPNFLTYAGGVLYGTDSGTGSATPQGTVFKFDLHTNKFSTLYRFRGHLDGAHPAALAYAGGFLYGVAETGGFRDGAGSVFRIDSTNGHETTIYDFSGYSDGTAPDQLTAFNGVLYGTTRAGGALDGAGTVFAVTP